ncbi:UDP pyrophosphate synthase [Rothia similmucilaginosa]|uniref:UDP pyrophosphate synthase n=1 Tax=Rothia sp. RSM42 TaxID=3030211 RepID=UPI0024483D5F|nr:UDP pyrophosphate synthase [Rothia sp. RSM42]
MARATAAILLGLTLSSCSFGPPLEKDESARAIFDVENDQVILPLDAYDTTGKDEYFTKALELARKKCFAEHGQHYEMFVRTEGAGRNYGRTYGFWNVERAQKYGLHEPNESNTLDLSSPAPSSDPGKDVRTECYQRAIDEMKQIGEIPFGSATYRRLETDARDAAGDRQLKKSLDDEWKRCVKDKGLTPDSEMTVKEEKNIPQSTTPSEEEIRIATIQAQCNQDVGRSQKLYDLEAQYQKPLIAKNQAALENELKEFKRRDEQFKQYVLDNQ